METEKGKYLIVGPAKQMSKVFIITTAVIFLVFVPVGSILLFGDIMASLIFLPVLPFVIIFGLIAFLFSKKEIPSLKYVKLTDDSLIVCAQAIPFTIKYSEIERVGFSDGILKRVDMGKLTPYWPYVKLIKPDEFMKDFSDKYRRNTGKELIIKS